MSLDGAPGAIGFFSSLQKESEKYLGVKFKVTHGGTYYGGGNNGLDLYAETVGDFAGNKQLEGSITTLNSGRQFGMGSPGGTLVTAHTGTELGYRMGASTIMCETTHDAPFHYMGVGLGIVLGQAHDYPIDLLDNHDAPVNRRVSVGHNPFAAMAGGTVYLPKKEYERIIESGLMLKETFYRIHKKRNGRKRF